MIVVEDGKSKFTEEKVAHLKAGEIRWADLIEQGVIEYVDAAEEENAFVALYEDDLTNEHTHLEISPITILTWIGSFFFFILILLNEGILLP